MTCSARIWRSCRFRSFSVAHCAWSSLLWEAAPQHRPRKKHPQPRVQTQFIDGLGAVRAVVVVAFFFGVVIGIARPHKLDCSVATDIGMLYRTHAPACLQLLQSLGVACHGWSC